MCEIESIYDQIQFQSLKYLYKRSYFGHLFDVNELQLYEDICSKVHDGQIQRVAWVLTDLNLNLNLNQLTDKFKE